MRPGGASVPRLSLPSQTQQHYRAFSRPAVASVIEEMASAAVASIEAQLEKEVAAIQKLTTGAFSGRSVHGACYVLAG